MSFASFQIRRAAILGMRAYYRKVKKIKKGPCMRFNKAELTNSKAFFCKTENTSDLVEG